MSAKVQWDGKHYDLKQCGAVLLDLDGTLWDSSEVVVHAWQQILQGMGRQVTAEDIRGIMGMQIPEISRRLLPGVSEAEAGAMIQRCCRLECGLIRKEGGHIFPGVETVIRTLAKRMPVAIVSNCQEGYIESFLAYYHLEDCVCDSQFAGMLGYTKGQNIRRVVARNGMGNPCYVGDTVMDEAASAEADVPFIHAAYGFGRVKACAASIRRPLDLLDLLG